MKDKLSCGIIKDLLIGYIENTLSDESSKLVKEHINNCDECKREYEILSSSINLDYEYDQKLEKEKFNYLKRVNSRFSIILITLFILAISSLILYLIHFEPTLDGSLFILAMISVIIDSIIRLYAIPIIGLSYGIACLKNKHKKIYIIPIIIFGVWLASSIYNYTII